MTKESCLLPEEQHFSWSETCDLHARLHYASRKKKKKIYIKIMTRALITNNGVYQKKK